MNWNLPEDQEKLFWPIISGLKNAKVSCKFITNRDDDPTLWAIMATVSARINGVDYTVKRQTPFYPEGKRVDSKTVLRDINSLSSTVAMALGYKVFKA